MEVHGGDQNDRDASRRRASSVRPSVNLFSSGSNPFASTGSAEPQAKPPPPPPPPPIPAGGPQDPVALVLGDTPEQTFLPAVQQLVAQFAAHLPGFTKLPKDEQQSVYKSAFSTMAKAVTRALALYQIPAPDQASHLLTLSCHRVVKDALSRNPKSFEDGRMEQGLCRLCADFISTMS